MKGTTNQSAPSSAPSHMPVHLADLPDPPTNWRSMLNHPHADGFRRAAEMEYSALEARGTWEIIDRENNEVIQPIEMGFHIQVR